mmetsp:Transcript_32547/g.75263  ORF Transcript_32547/g.75263 Transcript_32547/m.75263 type:complete len:379 (-) Transcript_32547:96-1232(-)
MSSIRPAFDKKVWGEFTGVAPQSAGPDWEARFWETDGWEGYQESEQEAFPACAKWWHVPDERIHELIGLPRELRRVSKVSQTEQVEEVNASDEGMETNNNAPIDATDIASGNEPVKQWKVPDEAILRLIEEMEQKAQTFNRTGAELLELGQAGQARTWRRAVTKPQPRTISVRVLWTGTGEILSLLVPSNMPIDPPQDDGTEVKSGGPLRKPRSRASLALQRLLRESHGPSPSQGMHKPGQPRLGSGKANSLKTLIESITGVPPSLQKLVHDKRLCRRGATLQDIGVADGDQITLVVPRLPRQPDDPEPPGRSVVVTRRVGPNYEIRHPWKWGIKSELSNGKRDVQIALGDRQSESIGGKSIFKLRARLDLYGVQRHP